MTELSQPFYGFLITLSSHNPFGLPEYLQEIELEPQDENIVGRYIQSVNYADRCLSEFFDELKEAGLYDNSLILIYGDHFELARADEAVRSVVSEWLGRDYTKGSVNITGILLRYNNQWEVVVRTLSDIKRNN